MQTERSIRTVVDLDAGPSERQRADWDALALGEAVNVPFALAAWQDAWRQHLDDSDQTIRVWAYLDDRPVGAAAFARYGSTLRFAGRGASDYCAILLADGLDRAAARATVDAVLTAALEAAPRARAFRLARMYPAGRSLEALRDSAFALLTTEGADAPAPVMAMSAVADRLAKKSLKRHAKKLGELGEVRITTYTDAPSIEPRLETLFALHEARWRGTGTPSLFERPEQRAFYAEVIRTLAPFGLLRYTVVEAGDRVVACHLGFCHGGRFVWYKPAFDPEFARYSPGEVLLKHLLERARDESCEWFDFTIGDEPFKLRFSTEVVTTRRLYVTRSLPRHWLERAKRRLRPG